MGSIFAKNKPNIECYSQCEDCGHKVQHSLKIIQEFQQKSLNQKQAGPHSTNLFSKCPQITSKPASEASLAASQDYQESPEKKSL